MNPLTFRERVLYHQIHPLKPATDWATAFIAAWFFWRHDLMLGLVVGLVPPIVVTALLMRFANLAYLKETALGRYVALHMNRAMEAVRVTGLVIFWVGAWARQLWMLPVGVAVVLAGWMRGLRRR